jgi:hypothetical protein
MLEHERADLLLVDPERLHGHRYALEDQIHVELDRLSANLAHFKRAPAVTHGYPHPKTPSLDVDHRGR